MKNRVVKQPKISLCRVCHGTGSVPAGAGGEKPCPQCEGSGRVTVSAVMELDIRPYKPEGKEE